VVRAACARPEKVRPTPADQRLCAG
jgi:hypothetical protein